MPIEKRLASLRALLLLIFFLAIPHFAVGQSSAGATEQSDGIEFFAGSVKNTGDIVRWIKLSGGLLPAPVARFSLSSFTPFCRDYAAPEMANDVIPECIRWEEQELDMLHMYMDLISVGMDIDLATQFYEEVRCLSRANIFPVPELKAWEVCFSYDYSELVGNLLANYILRDMALDSKTAVNTTARLSETGRFFSFGRAQRARHARSSARRLFNLFGDGSRFRIYSAAVDRKERSCCESCTNKSYFVNVEKGQCIKDPFGTHCCHKACKSLGRLKIGASSSTAYCCKRCRPLPCAR